MKLLPIAALLSFINQATFCSFSLDALQATQIAERLGLAGSGVAELEEELALGGDLEGPLGPHDRPYALPLGRNPRTTSPARSPNSEYGEYFALALMPKAS